MVEELHFIGGVDVSAQRKTVTARAAIVILSYPDLEVVEFQVAEDSISFPYVPGYLSFRELPLVLAACRKVSVIPDLILVDGHGIAHPRGFGLASHLGVLLDIPTMGCAKSRLCGSHPLLPAEAGAYVDLIDGGKTVGAALRTRAGASPMYISIGHKIDLPAAIYWAIRCCRGHRLPEPCRLAHLAAGGRLVVTHLTGCSHPNQAPVAEL